MLSPGILPMKTGVGWDPIESVKSWNFAHEDDSEVGSDWTCYVARDVEVSKEEIINPLSGLCNLKS